MAVLGIGEREKRLAEAFRNLADSIEGSLPATLTEDALAGLLYGAQDYIDGAIGAEDLDGEVTAFRDRIGALRIPCPDCTGIDMPPQASCTCAGRGWLWRVEIEESHLPG